MEKEINEKKSGGKILNKDANLFKNIFSLLIICASIKKEYILRVWRRVSDLRTPADDEYGLFG